MLRGYPKCWLISVHSATRGFEGIHGGSWGLYSVNGFFQKVAHSLDCRGRGRNFYSVRTCNGVFGPLRPELGLFVREN